MKLDVTSDNYNRLLKRREIDLSIDHIEESTPSMAQMQQLVASQMGAATTNTEIKEVMTQKGAAFSTCRAFVWDEKSVKDLSAKEEKKEE